MSTEAQKKANRKYRQGCKSILLRYSKNELEDYEKARKIGTRKIKELIKEKTNDK